MEIFWELVIVTLQFFLLAFHPFVILPSVIYTSVFLSFPTMFCTVAYQYLKYLDTRGLCLSINILPLPN